MYLYIHVCKVLYLWVYAIKASFGKLEGVASGTHYTQEQLRLPLNTAKGCQGTIHNMRLQNMIHLIHNAFRIYLFMTVHTSSYQFVQV